ncbi:hypothetical protein CPB85DRAFT_751303 [Mucidula mucida]|nr:hypothetical protein CPB85DRAFT_751303 [Mucidula mucida]
MQIMGPPSSTRNTKHPPPVYSSANPPSVHQNSPPGATRQWLMTMIAYSNYSATDCPKRVLHLNLTWPILCLFLQAVILVGAVIRLFNADRSLPGTWNHLLSCLFFIVSTYCSLIVLPCPTHSALRLAGVFALAQTTFFVSSIIFTGNLHGTGLYGSFLRGVGDILHSFAAKVRTWALFHLGEAPIALPGPEILPSYTDTSAPDRLTAPKLSLSLSHPATRMV